MEVLRAQRVVLLLGHAVDRLVDGEVDAQRLELRARIGDRDEPPAALAGLLEDAGVPNADANAAVTALTKVFNPRSMRAGQTFQLTFQLPPEAVPLPPDTTPGVINIPLPDRDQDDADPNGVVTPVTPTPVGRLLSIAFSPTVEHNITIARSADGIAWTETRVAATFDLATGQGEPYICYSFSANVAEVEPRAK